MSRYFTLQNTTDTSVTSGTLIGQLGFAASNDSDGGDAIVITAAVIASADGTFDATNNPGSLVFATSPTGPATGQIKIVDSGHLEPIGNKIKNLGSSSSQWKDLYVDQIYFDGLGPQTLPFNDFNVSATGDTVTVTDGNTITFTGAGDNVVSRDGQTIIISGTGTAGGGGMTSWTIADGSGNTEAVGDADTLYISGAGSVVTDYNTTTNVMTISGAAGGGGGTPGGSDTHVQFNDGGSTFGGNAGFTYDKTAQKMYSRSYYTNITDSGNITTSVTLDLDESNFHQVTLSGNPITIAVSNGDVGQRFIIRLKQDNTGSRTVNWFSTISWPGGGPPALSTATGVADLLGFVVTAANEYDGFIMVSGIY